MPVFIDCLFIYGVLLENVVLGLLERLGPKPLLLKFDLTKPLLFPFFDPIPEVFEIAALLLTPPLNPATLLTPPIRVKPPPLINPPLLNPPELKFCACKVGGKIIKKVIIKLGIN